MNDPWRRLDELEVSVRGTLRALRGRLRGQPGWWKPTVTAHVSRLCYESKQTDVPLEIYREWQESSEWIPRKLTVTH